MARDRQRAKQRQQKRRAGESPDSAADGGGGGTPIPSPLEHASAEVDIAQEAIEFGASIVAGEVPAGAEDFPEDAAAPPGGSAPEAARDGNRVLNFLRACWAELQRVQWPNRRQVAQATGVVLGFVLIAGGYLGLMDAIFSRFVDVIL